MQKYHYRPLEDGPLQTRLLIIQPATSADAALRCRIVPHELQDPYEQADCYDALSYAWGSSELTQQMWTHDDVVLPVTQNLYDALIHLRHRSLERILWADAVCIDQSNDREKERQIMIMRRIYAHAQCVIVWLGSEADDSTVALNTIRDASFEEPPEFSNASPKLKSLEALFSRPWFSRIWIIQEVEAAQNVRLLCGKTELDKKSFNLGLIALFTRKQSQAQGLALSPFASLIESLTLVMRSSGYMSSPFGKERPSLGQLLDIFRYRESSKAHDQVYALLGMSGDTTIGADIRLDYRKPWFEVQKEVFCSIVGTQLQARFERSGTCLIVQTSGYVVGHVTSKKHPTLNSKAWNSVIIWDGIRYGYAHSSSYDLGPGPDVEEGDMLCRLSGTNRLIIARLRCFHLEVICVCLPLPLSNFSASLDLSHHLYSLELIWHCGCGRHPEDPIVHARLDSASFDPDLVRLANGPTHKRESPIMMEIQRFIDHISSLETSFSSFHSDHFNQVFDRITEIINMKRTQDPKHGQTILCQIMSILDNLISLRYDDLKIAMANRAAMQKFSYDIRFVSPSLVERIIESLQAFIESMFCRSGSEPYGWSFIRWAASAGQQDLLRRSLQSSTTINPDDQLIRDDMKDALFEACFRGHTEIVGLLLEYSKSGFLNSDDVQQAINLASFSGCIEVVDMFVQEGARIDEFGFCLFEEFRGFHTVRPIESFETYSEYKYKPLQLAVEGNHVAMAKFLLDNGAQSGTISFQVCMETSIFAAYAAGGGLAETPLTAAMRVGNPEMISLLKNYTAREEETQD